MKSIKSYTTLISTEELSLYLADPAWHIFDCRFDLAHPGWGIQDYQEGHIPGAVYVHLEEDLSAQVTPTTGRHPLPAMEAWEKTLSYLGVEENSQVLVYDTTGGSFAARMWWMLRWAGHLQAAVLDGGFTAWKNENRPTAKGIETSRPAVFHVHPQTGMTADQVEVEQLRRDPSYILIDARSAERFRGENEPIDPIPGRIPGAVNRFHGLNLADDGKMLPAEVLRGQFEALLGGRPAEQAVVYCGSGVTSCHHLLAMEVANLPGARLYPGSWSEWIRNPQNPRATGAPGPSERV